MRIRKDDQDSLKPGWGTGAWDTLHRVHFLPAAAPRKAQSTLIPSGSCSTGTAGNKSIPCHFHLPGPKQPRAGEAAQASPKTLWHRPRAQPGLLQHQSQTAAQAAFSILHTLLDSELDKSQSVQNGDHTTRSRIVGCSSIPMAQKHLVEVWRGQAGSGGSYCQLHLRFPKDRPCSHPDRAQLSHTPWDSGEAYLQFVWKGQTGSSQQWAGVNAPRT